MGISKGLKEGLIMGNDLNDFFFFLSPRIRIPWYC